MANIEAYEANLDARLAELRKKDFAYHWNTRVILDSIIYSAEQHGSAASRQKILDCGCGLGFLTASLDNTFGNNTVGIDISERSISKAQKEHPGTKFYVSAAETFRDKMPELGLEAFDIAILNMVLHSVDNEEAGNILNGIAKCLKPEGTLIILTPNQQWLIQKLEEHAKETGMRDEAMQEYVGSQLTLSQVELPIKITGGNYWPSPITIYNRAETDYAKLLVNAGFGFPWVECDESTGDEIGREHLPYTDMNDYSASQLVYEHHRVLMMSFKFNLDPQLFENYFRNVEK